MVHENINYLAKKEEKVTSICKEVINQTYIKLKLMTGGIKQKNNYETLRVKVRGFFKKWRRVTFLDQQGITENDRSTQDYSPILPNNSFLSSNYKSTPKHVNIAPYKSLQRER